MTGGARGGIGLDALLALERMVWEALAAGDAAADARLLAEEFLGVYPSGFAGRDDHAGQLVEGPTVARWRIAEARAVPLGPDAALLCYRADYSRAASPETPERMYVSSLWTRRDGLWVNLFSQDTPAGAAPVP